MLAIKPNLCPGSSTFPENFVIKPTKGWSAKNVFVNVDAVNLLDQKEVEKKIRFVKSLEKNSELDSNDRIKLLL